MKNTFLTLSLLVAIAPALRSETASGATIPASAPKDEATKLPPTASPAVTPAVSPTPSPAALPGAKRVTAETAARIGANAPRFSATKAPDPAAKELPDLRELDKPRNRIPRLPREMIEKPPASRTPMEASAEVLQLPAYVVREDKVPDFKEREMLTPQGKLNLAYKRHPGLKIGSLPFLSNDGWGLFMLEEEQRLERKAEMEDLMGLYRYSDPKGTKTLSRQANETFMPAGSGRN